MLKKKEHLQEVQDVYNETGSSIKTAEIIAKRYGIPQTDALSRKIRRWVDKGDISLDSEIFEAAKLRSPQQSQYYIITSAQNATKIHKKLWTSIQGYADYLGASIEVIPIRYRNPTSIFKELPYDWWAEELQPYLIANRHNIHPHLTVLGDLKSQPTAALPLSGLEGLSTTDSCIVGHPRQHFVTMPVLEGYREKFLLSTGSITVENYTDTKSGKKGEFHHTLGFVIVEVRNDDTFHIRQVSANKDGSFYDLDYKVDGYSVTQGNFVDAVVLGDVHVGRTDIAALSCSYDMLGRFKPKYVVVHDLMDGYSISHHEIKNPFVALSREEDGTWSLEEELEHCMDFIETILEYNPVIVRSNHDDFVDRWLCDIDWRKEKNKYAYLKYAKLKADGQLPKGILPYELEQRFGKKVVSLSETDSFKVNGIEFAVHGHLGVNGSRGNINQYKRLNTKLVTGHYHSPAKIDNVTQVGTLTMLRLGYNKGLSNWAHSNAITHKNGKTQLIIISKDGYTTL